MHHSNQRLLVGLLIIAGLLLRLWIAPSGGHPGDLPVLARWSMAAQQHGWLNLYATSDANYPPLGTAMISSTAAAFGILRPNVAIVAGDPLWLLLLKLPAILSDTLLAILVAITARRRNALWVAATVFNPALIIMSAWWGQLDSVVVLFAASAILAVTTDRPFIAGVLLATATLIKPQGIIVAPIVILAMDAQKNPLRRTADLAAGSLITTLITVAPFIATRQLQLVMARSIALIASPGWPTVNALNLWYLLTNGVANWAFDSRLITPDTTPIIFGLSMRAMGILVLLVWTITVLVLTWHSRHETGVWFLASALLVCGIFLFPTQVHERYLLGALPLALLYAASNRRDPGAFFLPLWLTVTLTLNLIWAAPVFPILLDNFARHYIAGMLIALTILGGAITGLAHLYPMPAMRYDR